MKKIAHYLVFLLFILISSSCVSTRSTLKNVDNTAPSPTLKDNAFVLKDYSKDTKYGFDPDYPVNVFFQSAKDENLNAERYLRALTGPNGEKISFVKVESCCPFPTKRTEMGAGFLDIYELQWEGQKKPIKLYINIYERGYLLVPVGLSAKK
ncbi:2-dehydro-3-deoxyphosphooctonate aldolase [Flavobacterium buctense]|uniref:2-dehydro-3-deoxyphosphooctonate aldolase n=1 Tax=Flavobacterium buctense TaxID=1648146 RepID=A0ABU9DZF3_9FLAO|nr:2-dehydro-3-deoxyphosphooctonate aldolase [Flavobacterium buctense]